MTDAERAEAWKRIALECRSVIGRLMLRLGQLAGEFSLLAEQTKPLTAGQRALCKRNDMEAMALVEGCEVVIPAELSREIGE